MSDKGQSPDTKLDLEPGRVIDQRYRILRSLSQDSKRGAYLSKSEQDPEQLVVIRVLHVIRDDEDRQAVVDRFKREFDLSHRISHTNLVKVLDFIDDGELLAYTMEYLGDNNLRTLLNNPESISIDKVREILIHICSGVNEIHREGIIHLELYPENILLTDDGQVKVSDFGIIRAENQKEFEERVSLLGTMDYFSPEYVSEGLISSQLDVYAIGVVAYELITGRKPFQSKEYPETADENKIEDPQPPENYNADCPSTLSKIVLKALEGKQKRRYKNAGEILADLLKEEEPSSVKEETQQLPPDDWLAVEPRQRRPSDVFSTIPDTMDTPRVRTERYQEASSNTELSGVAKKARLWRKRSNTGRTNVQAGSGSTLEQYLIIIVALMAFAMFVYLLFFYD